MFKIIGIETIPEYGMMDFLNGLDSYARPYEEWIEREKQARYDCVHRILKNNGNHKPYLLFNNYSINGGHCKRLKNPMIDEGFYKVGDIQVSISAIVGRNGSGKSSLIDLMLRLLNNMAYALKAGIDNNFSYELHYAECVYGRLYIEDEDGDIYIIEQKDHHFLMAKNNKLLFNYNNIADGDSEPHWNQWNDFGIEDWDKKNNEEKCKTLLGKLFYTIIVNYAAYAYNINDYEAEWSDHDERTTVGRYKLLTKEEAKTQEEENQQVYLKGRESDEEKCWIGALFHKNDAYQTPIVINPFRTRGNVDYNREKGLLNERIYLLLMKNMQVVTALLDGKKPYKFEFVSEQQYLPLEGQKSIFFCKNVFDALNDLDAFRAKIDVKGDVVAYSTGEPEPEKMGQMVEKCASNIIDCWERCLRFRLVPDIHALTVKDDSDEIAALNYVVYKTIKSTYYYSKYRRFQNKVIAGEGLEELVMTMYCDTTHVTLKLRRALAFLIFGGYGANHLVDGNQRVNEKKIADYQLMVANSLANQKKMVMQLKEERPARHAFSDKAFKDLRLKKRGKWIEEELMPTPSLKVSLIMHQKNGDDISFDTLSSGEKQIIYTLGTAVYQLHHLNSADDSKIQYKNVNLILDEVELYFHPSYQQGLVKRLLDVIESLGLNVIRNINIIFATHSPFILSDVPKDNILYLKKGIGCSEEVEVNPLGANINDVLHQSFFLDKGFMGDYIKERLENLINYMTNPNRQKDDFWDTHAEKLILAIGDPFLRDQLTDMYMNMRFGKHLDAKKDWLRNKLEELD